MSTTRPDRVHGLGPTRARVLALLQDADAPLSAASVAEHLRTHPNTARFHLDALCGAGLAVRVGDQLGAPALGAARPGRPTVRYRADTGAPPASRRSYRFLAEVLTTHLAVSAADPVAEAVAAGEAAGRRAALNRPRLRSARSAGLAVVDALAELGFESRAAEDESGVRLDVSACPFLEVATENLDIVCSVHRGLMQGLLDELRAPVGVDRLDPLVGPSHCVAHLART